jgi:hypothetical protein
MPTPSKPARAERYRQLAAQTLKRARSVQSDEIKATYLSLAQCWKNLADQAERLCREFGDEYVEADAAARPPP